MNYVGPPVVFDGKMNINAAWVVRRLAMKHPFYFVVLLAVIISEGADGKRSSLSLATTLPPEASRGPASRPLDPGASSNVARWNTGRDFQHRPLPPAPQPQHTYRSHYGGGMYDMSHVYPHHHGAGPGGMYGSGAMQHAHRIAQGMPPGLPLAMYPWLQGPFISRHGIYPVGIPIVVGPNQKKKTKDMNPSAPQPDLRIVGGGRPGVGIGGRSDVITPMESPMPGEGGEDGVDGAMGEEDRHPCEDMCKPTQFTCLASCICIPSTWRCDGDADCADDEDEVECEDEPPSMGGGMAGIEEECLSSAHNVRCPRTGKCIKEEWLCDGEDDCGDFSDETRCGFEMNCTEDEFPCDNGLCVRRSWRCDGENDCKDFSDEQNCTRKTSCEDNEFQCSDGSCISLTWKCDLETDCSDGSDEVECAEVEPAPCGEGEFQCAYPRCVRQEFRCDGDDDCGDWSDEDDCPRANAPTQCNAAEFKCDEGKCISELSLCDGEKDCENGEDEEGCAEKSVRMCTSEEFSCGNHGNCILKTWVCDGVQDCSDGEDESTCEAQCEKSQFRCGNVNTNDTTSRGVFACIGRKHVCDGKKDCPKGEDEKNCPRKKECEAGSKCQQGCVTLPDGTDGCTCHQGFALNSDNYSCHDVNECLFETDPVCSQTCNNTIGSFTCGCMTGYVLRPDGRTCKALGAAPTLLFANRVDIRQVSLNSVKYTALLKGLHNAIALDYHYAQGLIFWSDVSMDVIKRASLNGSGSVDIIRWGLESPGGIAVDWVHNLIFWTDSGTSRVEVASLDGMHRYIIASSDLDKPRAIVVHPGEALVFWTDWGPNPKIERAEMDGSNRKAVITEFLFWPNGMCIDYTTSRIYWADAKHHVIETAKFDGSDRKRVLSKGLHHPFALTLFEDAIYWTDWHTKSIQTANKNTGMGLRTIHSRLHFPMDIHSYHPQRQPSYPNRCGKNNGGCSHMCLPNRSSSRYQCVCPMGLKLRPDGKSCESTPEKLLLFARKKDLRVRQLGVSPDKAVDMAIPLDGIQSAVALAWDSDTDSIFWTDVEADTISCASLNGSNERIIINSNLESPAGLAVDWVTKKLYWTDAGTNRVEVSNLDGTMRALLVWEGLDKPRDIVVDPLGGYMYWSDWGQVPKIERAGMDGSIRAPLITQNLVWPNGLAIDYERAHLYWADGGTKAIEFASLDGTGRTTLIGSDLPHPFGLAIFENKIYWTDWNTTSIHMADKMTGKNKTVLRSGISGLMDVRVFHRGRIPVPTNCSSRNGGCSHLCLLAPAPRSFSCACPIGIKIGKNQKTCASGPTNSLIFAHRVDIRQISLDVSYSVDVVLPLPSLKNAIAVDVDRKTGELYWTDTAEDTIQKSTPDGKFIETIIQDGLETADGIVVDSTGRKLYWTDAGRNSIEVAELDGRNRKVLIWVDLESPRAITLHYNLGLMYWSDWGKNARIEQAHMDGKSRKILVSDNLGWPNGLAIDRPAGRIYWCDGKRKTLESTDLSGDDRKVVVTDVPHPYGLVIVGTHVYWTDWKTEALHRADKNNGSDNVVIRGKLEGLMDIRSVQQVDNFMENACGFNNGGCSHLCLRQPDGYSCACPTGTLLQNDAKTCNTPPSKYLLFATRNTLARVSLDTPELWDVTLPIPDVHNAIAVDFHWGKQKVYYTDVHLDIIRGVDMHNLSNTEVIVSWNLTTPDGLAVDWIADNIYWTDAGRKVLEVARIDGTCRKIVISEGLDEPRALAIFPRKGFLYWTDWGDNPKIERSLLDGSSRTMVISTDLGFPNGLALDYEARRLYWVDALRDRIETSDLYGQNRVQLVPEATHPFGLTQYGDHIYWTDWYKKSVERADKRTGKDRIVIRTDLDGVMEIRAVAEERQTGWTPCADNNGGCSHLCFYRPKGYVCACPDIPDDRICSTEPSVRVINTNTVDYDNDSEFLPPVTPPDIGGPIHRVEIADLDDFKTKNSKSENVGIPSHVIIIIGVLLSLLIVATMTMVLVLLYHRRKRQKKYLYATGRSVLTFSNPNYNASSSEVGPGSAQPADKRPFLWKRLRYDKAQERVYNIHDDKQGTGPEVVSLIPAVLTPNKEATTPERVATPPPTPPQRLDSINLKAG